MTVIEFSICCCVPNFIKIGSYIWAPDARNCWMFNARLLGNGRCHGSRIMADVSGTQWDVTTQVSSKSATGRRVIAFPTFSNVAPVRHLESEFCYCAAAVEVIRVFCHFFHFPLSSLSCSVLAIAVNNACLLQQFVTFKPETMLKLKRSASAVLAWSFYL